MQGEHAAGRIRINSDGRSCLFPDMHVDLVDEKSFVQGRPVAVVVDREDGVDVDAIFVEGADVAFNVATVSELVVDREIVAAGCAQVDPPFVLGLVFGHVAKGGARDHITCTISDVPAVVVGHVIGGKAHANEGRRYFTREVHGFGNAVIPVVIIP